MNVKRRIHLLIILCTVFVFPATSVFAGAKPIKLDWVSFVPKNNYVYQLTQKYFIDKVNERAKGELVIQFRGGPETFSAFDIPKAVQRGVVDIGTTFAGAIEPVVPGVQGDMLIEITLDEERRPGGAYDFLLNMYKKGGLYYLGRGIHQERGFFYTALRNKKVEKLEDLKGLTLGGTTAAQAPAIGWGCTYAMIPDPDSYTALERGVVDALQALPASGYRYYSVYEVVKYIIDPGVFNSTVRIFMNLESFNKLPKNLQDILMDTFVEAEKIMAKEGTAKEAADIKWMVDNGNVELIKFSEEDTAKYLDAANQAAWEYQQKRFPEVTPKLKELLTK